jgi:outer membrane protein assembly factor BamB
MGRFATLKVLAVGALASASLFGVVATAPASSTTPVNMLTWGYGNARTDHDVTDGRVTRLSSGVVWHAHLDQSVYGQPLAFGGNVVVGTENNTLYVLNPRTGARVWSIHLQAPVRTSIIDQATGLGGGCGDIDPLGITGTPVISSTGIAYVAYEGYSGTAIWQHIRHYLAAINLVTHKRWWTRIIDPPGGNTANGYTIAAEQQRPALLLYDNRVYVNFGGLAGDCGLYHGYVLGVPANGVGGELNYKVPTQTEGAIWSVGGAVVATNGDIVVATGNGGTDTYDGSDSVIELTPTLRLQSEWAPTDWSDLSANDWDLGSGGVIQVPGTTWIFAAGKQTTVPAPGFLVALGHLGHGPANAPFTAATCNSGDGGVFGQEADYQTTVSAKLTTFIYVPCQNGIEAITAVGGLHPTFAMRWAPSTGSPDGSPMVAGGYVWALDYYNGGLYGMSPTTGQVVFQRNTDGLNHFAVPSLALGHILVPTSDGVEAFAVAT